MGKRLFLHPSLTFYCSTINMLVGKGIKISIALCILVALMLYKTVLKHYEFLQIFNSGRKKFL